MRSQTPDGWLLWAALLGAIVLAVAGRPAAASAFSVAPVRLDLDSAHPTQVLTLRNEGNEPVVIQIRAVEWSQPNGADWFVDTRDVLVAPPVLTLVPHATQVLRVVLRRQADLARELSYRLFLQEVPQAAGGDERQLKLALRMSLPIFVPPRESSAGEPLGWSYRRLGDDSLQLQANNPRSSHVQIRELHVDFGAGVPEADIGSGKYILPGSRATWTIPGLALAGGPPVLRVRGRSDVGEFSESVVAVTAVP